MFSKILAVPFVVAALVFLYLTWEYSESYSWYIIFPVVAVAIIYVFSPQLNWWWWRWYPPKLDPPVIKMLANSNRFYAGLPTQDKKRFLVRMALYMKACDFKPQAMERVPEDVKAMLASAVVQITYGQEDFLLPKFENIVVYPKRFPSPLYLKDWHSSELFEEDGVLIFAADHIMPGGMQPAKYYHSAIHEYCKAYRLSYPEKNYPAIGEEHWPILESISKFKKEAIEKWIGLPNVQPGEVAMTHFFVFPLRFKQELPEIYQQYTEVFNLDPAAIYLQG